MDEQEKNTKLNQLIDEMCNKEFATDISKINAWIQTLNRIYANGYRHRYSNILLQIQAIIDNNDSETLETLGENLNVLKDAINSQIKANSEDANLKNTYNGFCKFSDHIALEIGRFNFLNTHFNNTSNNTVATSLGTENSSELNQLKDNIQKLSSAIDKMRPITLQAKKELDNLDSKLESNKISSITTLTIFSAVVLAFSGGITFEAGIFKGLENTSVYRLVNTIALTGFILFNTIFALLYLVGKLSGKNISTKCKYYADFNSSEGKMRCGDGFCGKCCHSVSIPCRIFHKYSYVFFVDIVLLWTIYVDVLLWGFKNNVLSPLHIIFQSVPVFFIIAVFIYFRIYQCVKINRVKVKFKIDILRTIVAPEDSNRIFSRLYSVLSSAFGHKSIPERYLDDIHECNYKEALELLDDYADDSIILNKEYFEFISHKENKLLKKQLKDLLSDFEEYIKNKKDNKESDE